MSQKVGKVSQIIGPAVDVTFDDRNLSLLEKMSLKNTIFCFTTYNKVSKLLRTFWTKTAMKSKSEPMELDNFNLCIR